MELQPPRIGSLAELIFAGTEDGTAPILHGCLVYPELCNVTLSLGQLRRVALTLMSRFARLGIAPGDTVALVRLPRTSELPAAALYAALSAWGVRVLFPMYLDLQAISSWIELCGVRTLLAASEETTGSDVALAARLANIAEAHDVRMISFHHDLDLPALVRHPPAVADSGVEIPPAELDDECLLLTTSGTSGAAKIVRYTQGALLRCCASWEQAGLFRPDLLGGRGLSLLLAHSMGLRGLWNALWTRQPLCLITPEWFFEHPERVASLLLQMKPEHVTGGPATFHTLLEFARIYPGLKEQCFRSLRCLVSSGAPYDRALARRVHDALGLPLHNAFGMTELMQVLSTLVDGPHSTAPGCMGNPLPGVKLRLDGTGLPQGQHRLEVASPFGFAGYLDGPGMVDGWFTTGDLVRQHGDELCYLGREAADFINDGTGLKISRARLEQLYAGLDRTIDAIAFFPLRREVGLAALLFSTAVGPGEPVTDRRTLTRVQSLVEQRLERLHREMEELEFQQLSIGCLSLIDAPAPRTAKGTLALAQIERRWSGLIDRLTGRYTKHPFLVLLDRQRYARSVSIRLTSPRLGELLHLLELDKQLEGGQGDRLFYRDGEARRDVIDFVGGYGGNLLGHRHPEVIQAMQRFLDGDGIPLLDQGSARQAQGALARELALAVGQVTGGSYVVRLGSTGAEAVELALAHACLEREEAVRRLVRDQKRRFGHRSPDAVRRLVEQIRSVIRSRPPRILALEDAYHGHSLGARSVVFNEKMRWPFTSMSALDPIFVPRELPPGELDAIVARHRLELPLLEERDGRVVEETVALDGIIAAIAEPIQGEGGVREVPLALLQGLGRFGFPLILDEIQCGLGRSGRFLASEGARGDYYLLSKALGGGLVKVSALLVDRRRYLPRFDELYASTFAGDGLSSTVATRVLELVRDEGIPQRCRQRGLVLRLALERVQRDHPDVVRDVRGRGLILALELDRRAADRCFTLRTLAERELLGAVAASYLLNRHGVRLLPTLSAPDTLRVEPSAYIDNDAIEQLETALCDLCGCLGRGDSATLLAHLVRREEALDTASPETDLPLLPVTVEQPQAGASRVAFILHFVVPERELAMVDPSLGRLSSAARRALAERMIGLTQLKPTVTFARNLFDGRVWFAALLLPADVALLESLHRMDYRFLETERLQQAVDLAASLGCTCVALGGYTSIIARDGTAVLPPVGVQVTSGNTFTAVVGVRRLVQACRGAGIDPAHGSTRVGVVGATGNIGSSLIHRLIAGPWGFHRVLMVGRDPHRLARLEQQLSGPGGRPASSALGLQLQVSTDITDLRGCNVVAIATNTNEPLVYPEHLDHDRPVVIADVSVPSAVSREVRELDNVQLIPLAGTVVIPGAPDLVLSSHTPPGTAFCCAAEAMLIGLEPEATAGLRLTGPVEPRSMEVLDRLGQKHGLLSALGEGGFKLG